MKKLTFLISLFLLSTILSVSAQDAVVKKIIEPGQTDNQVMDHPSGRLGGLCKCGGLGGL